VRRSKTELQQPQQLGYEHKQQGTADPVHDGHQPRQRQTNPDEIEVFGSFLYGHLVVFQKLKQEKTSA